MNGAKVTAKQILELLKNRHGPPEWATFAELSERTGFAAGRIDLFAMNVWQSNKWRRVAYEIKVSRSDFKRELDNPEKRAMAEKVATETYFATPAGLIQPDEVPESWGLIEMIANGMRIRKHAMQREGNDSLPIEFIASILRRSADSPSRFPSAVWLLAGQEIDEDSLREAADAALHHQVQMAKLDARRQLEESQDFQDLRKIRDVVRAYLGWEYGDPDRLKKWFNNSSKADAVSVSPELRRALHNTLWQLKQMDDKGLI